MTDWFRSWHGAPTDPKWLAIAKRAQVAPGVVSAIVWALFDHASQQEERGSVETFDIETYSSFSGFEEQQISAVFKALEDKQIIIAGKLAKWERRQPKREGENSTNRVREHRRRAEQEPTLPLDEEKPEPAPTPRPPPEQIVISPEAMALSDEITAVAGHDPKFVPAAWCNTPYVLHEWLARGWQAPLILESVRAQIARKRDGPPNSVAYFHDGVARAHAQLGRTFPTVVSINGVRNGKSGITAAIDQYIADLERGGGEVREGPVGVLPDRRGERP